MASNKEQTLQIPALPRHFRGTITLDGSKSISNRALMMMALAHADADRFLSHLSTSNDTVTLQHLLADRDQTDTFDAGDAGTVFRFMAAYLAIRPGTQILTGSKRMLERPVGPLVTALRTLGAEITYLGNEGYPPLQIGTPQNMGVATNSLSINAGVSSQFLSALLMIGPYLPNGLELIPEGNMVSRSYLNLTMSVMREFGASCTWEGEKITVAPGHYTPKPFRVEADWSAASYWYSFVALAENAELHLKGLFVQSGQGDAVVQKMMTSFGVESTFTDEGVVIKKTGPAKPSFEWDFLECPDIAQTLAVTCAASGVQGLFCGLETLSIKETDRIAAIKQELDKTGVTFSKLPPRFSKKNPDKTYYLVDGQCQWAADTPPAFETYGDHRMAMSFAPLALLGRIIIEDPMVVGKSYPGFWKDLGHIFMDTHSFVRYYNS
jgi:3-phosphoshikimate 1-carboxyvinyltransferase